ncbi:hypothetical protein ARMGADRAFT_1090680 [Armillaria gallica]|uniref:Uncharacterized protein n=1 Tax=Armillaria gallica TaxID=47427 RepID=A0A2H3CGG7_ARMGA|nr:hypothetical protein ARMGADRAFT_1090680 [Armillaria gallica]
MEDIHVKDGFSKQVRINDLRELNSAPSVGMHDTPKGAYLGFRKESDTQERTPSSLKGTRKVLAAGLHRAKKREASGFCYINDIVLA